MNILMMSNTYKPFIGGVERSVEMFTEEYRRQGHRTIIVAPTYQQISCEPDVIRVPAIQHFNGTDFSVQLPIPGILTAALKEFVPDIVHSHHPFLIGDTAVRIAAKYNVPIVFTFHTFFERYTHYVPGDSPALKKFVVALSSGYANLCNHVIAPSGSVRDELRQRGVTAPISVIPTGIDMKEFTPGNRMKCRHALSIPHDAFVLGFVSRIAPEKNMFFLSRAIVDFLKKEPHSHFLCIGDGPSLPELKHFFKRYAIADRVHFTAALQGKELIDAYHAMDVFTFASLTETQGLVILEAMASGLPVVALDAPGIKDIIIDGVNGLLVTQEDAATFSRTIKKLYTMNEHEKKRLKKAMKDTVRDYTKEKCAKRILDIYSSLIDQEVFYKKSDYDTFFMETKRLIKAEMDIINNMAAAAGKAIKT